MRPNERLGWISSIPILVGLHRQCARILFLVETLISRKETLGFRQTARLTDIRPRTPMMTENQIEKPARP